MQETSKPDQFAEKNVRRKVSLLSLLNIRTSIFTNCNKSDRNVNIYGPCPNCPIDNLKVDEGNRAKYLTGGVSVHVA
jgi:hypothetical protein